MSPKPRLCMVVHGPYPIGEPRVTRETRAAVAAGWDVDVVAMRRAGEPSREVVDGANVIRLPLSHGRGLGALAMAREYLGFTLLASFSVARRMLRRRYDVVQVHNPPDFLIAVALIPKLLGARVVFDVHDLAPDMFAMRFPGCRGAAAADRVLRLMERTAGWIADAVVTVHDPYRRELVSRGIREAKTFVVMNSLDEALLPEPATPDGETFRIVYHGTVTPHYGVELLVDALAAVLPRVPNARLEVYGEGDATPVIAARAHELGVEHAVALTPTYLPQDEVLRRVNGASVGVIPNLPIQLNRFALSTKLFEYCALGIPVVCSDLPTLREHFDSSEIGFFTAGDQDALVGALIAVAEDPGAASEAAAAARLRYEEYRWDANAYRYLDVLHSLPGVPAPASAGDTRIGVDGGVAVTTVSR